MLNRPGFHTSEFIVAVLAVLASIISAAQDYISSTDASHLSILAAAAFIISRGLAKYEGRGTTPPTPPAG